MSEIAGYPSAKLQLARWRLVRRLRQRLCDRVNRMLCDPSLTYERMVHLVDLKPRLLVIPNYLKKQCGNVLQSPETPR